MKYYMVEYIVRTYVQAEHADQARAVSARMLDEMENQGELARECLDPQVSEVDEEGNMI